MTYVLLHLSSFIVQLRLSTFNKVYDDDDDDDISPARRGMRSGRVIAVKQSAIIAAHIFPHSLLQLSGHGG